MKSNFSRWVLVLLGLGADVVTVTGGTAGDAGSAAAEQLTYMSAKLLEVAEYNTILDQFGDKHPLPSNSSKTIRFTRMEKLTVAATPTQLYEGVSPSAVGLAINNFDAATEQYGNLIALSDLAELTSRHDLVQRAIYILGLNAAEVYDTVLFGVLNANTNVYRPNGRAGNTTLLSTDLVTYNDLVAIVATLMDQGARPFQGGQYVAVVPPQVYAGLLRDPDWKASVQFKAPDRIWRGEVDGLAQCRIVESNSPAFAPLSQSTSGATNKIYTSFFIGQFAYQVSDLQNLRIYVVAPGGQNDPLQQRRLIGWKYAAKSIITNSNWIRTVYSSGQNSVNN